jgi:DNA mismatch endonuclease, patch repair protein
LRLKKSAKEKLPDARRAFMKETAEQRSRIMRAVRSTDTGPEMIVRRLVYGMGYHYRLRRKDLPGKPDMVFAGRRKIIFVHGCFWHGHECRRGDRVPKGNREYWLKKIACNRERDRAALAALKKLGWEVEVIWECETHDKESLSTRVMEFLRSEAI